METKKIVRRKETRKERTYTIRLTESDFKRYEEMSIEYHIILSDLLRTAIEKGIKKAIK